MIDSLKTAKTDFNEVLKLQKNLTSSKMKHNTFCNDLSCVIFAWRPTIKNWPKSDENYEIYLFTHTSIHHIKNKLPE